MSIYLEAKNVTYSDDWDISYSYSMHWAAEEESQNTPLVLYSAEDNKVFMVSHAYVCLSTYFHRDLIHFIQKN